MLLIVWLVVGIGAVLLFAVLGYGLYGQLSRTRVAIGQAQTALGPQGAELAEGIRTAQAMRMMGSQRRRPSRVDSTHHLRKGEPWDSDRSRSG